MTKKRSADPVDFASQTEAAFAALAGEYRARKKAAEDAVCAWKWAKASWFDPRPLYLERHGWRPGRSLRAAPANPRNHCCCGLDRSGRVMVERDFNEIGFSETFYHWSSDSVVAAHYDHSNDKKPINLLVVHMESGRAIASYHAATGGFGAEEYHWVGSDVVEVKELHAKRIDGKLSPLQPYRTARAEYDAKGTLERVVCHWATTPANPKGGIEVTYERRKAPTTKLDLQNDFADIYEYVVRRVSTFDSRTRKGPGRAGPIRRIDVGFSFDQSGSVALIFDTRPRAEPDGEWNDYVDGNALEMPHWPEACDANENRALKVVLPDGTQRKLPSGSCNALAQMLGDMLKGVLLKARSNGVFDSLPRAKHCELGVDEQDGRYGWPIYEERGQDNLV
jgi:hypothetical protein